MAREIIPPEPLTDESPMPSGKHKGMKMIDVPAAYLLYVYENKMCGERVAKYVEDNLDVIKEQIKQDKL